MDYREMPFAVMDTEGRADDSDGSELIDFYVVNVVSRETAQVAYTIQSVPYVHGGQKIWLYANGEDGWGAKYREPDRTPVNPDNVPTGPYGRQYGEQYARGDASNVIPREDGEKRIFYTRNGGDYDPDFLLEQDGIHGMVVIDDAGAQKIFGLCRNSRFFELALTSDPFPVPSPADGFDAMGAPIAMDGTFPIQKVDKEIYAIPAFPELAITQMETHVTTKGEALTVRSVAQPQYTTNSDYRLANGQIEKLVTDGRHVMFAVNGRVFLRDTETETWPIDDNTQYEALEGEYVVDVDWLDGYFILTTRRGRILHTKLNAPAEVNALDFASAESNPDAIVGLGVLNRRIYIFGSRSVETWYNAGGQDFPFRRDNSFRFDQGARNKNAIAVSDVSVFFLGTDNIVYMASGGGFQRISNESVEKAIESSNPNLAHAFTYTEEGHRFYSLTLLFDDGSRPVNWTYDQTTRLWHRRSETEIVAAVNIGRHPAVIGRKTGGAKLEIMSINAVASNRRLMEVVLPVLRFDVRKTKMGGFRVKLKPPEGDDENMESDERESIPTRNDEYIELAFNDNNKQPGSWVVADPLLELNYNVRQWTGLGSFTEGRNMRLRVYANRSITLTSAYRNTEAQKR